MNQQTIQLLIEFAATIAIVLITRYLIPMIQNSTNKSDMEKATQWAEKAVYAADQIMKANSGDQRKAYVLEFMQKILDSENIKLSSAQIDILIEAAVKKMNLEKK